MKKEYEEAVSVKAVRCNSVRKIDFLQTSTTNGVIFVSNENGFCLSKIVKMIFLQRILWRPLFLLNFHVLLMKKGTYSRPHNSQNILCSTSIFFSQLKQLFSFSIQVQFWISSKIKKNWTKWSIPKFHASSNHGKLPHTKSLLFA